MVRQGPFRTIFPPFAGFLERQGMSVTLLRFVARNFLLDENVVESRGRAYGGYGAANGFVEPSEWVGAHEAYLGEEVFCERPANGPPRTLDPARHDRCPQTFRVVDNFVTYGKADKALDLLRVLSARSFATRTRKAVKEIVEAGREIVRASVANRPAAPRHQQVFDGALAEWNKLCDLRPFFVSFYTDHEDLFESSPDADAPGWADELRDRLGLGHLDPGTRGEMPILVFRYAVGEVPKRRRTRLKPLAVPSILDGQMTPAFCPAPNGVGYGHTVHLRYGGGGNSDGSEVRPCREVVHPHLDLQAEQLFRVGVVQQPVPRDLFPARKAHLLTLRMMAGRDDYATATDPEV